MKNVITFVFAAMYLLVSAAIAQERATITGMVRHAETGGALAGCNLIIEGATLGTVTDAQGHFQLAGVPYGKATLIASLIGYESKRLEIAIAEPALRIEIRLTPKIISGPAVTVVATRARERETPVAFATLTKNDIQARYFAQDIPVLLSAAIHKILFRERQHVGYNYLSIRGFDQRRIRC
jgi:iron complex outermembrane receptor protein